MAGPPQLKGVVRVLIADDHELFATSLMTVLCEDDRVEVVGIAETAREPSSW